MTAAGTEITFEADGDLKITGTNSGTFLVAGDVIEFEDKRRDREPPPQSSLPGHPFYTVKAADSTSITIDGASAGITQAI